jgi:trimethylamine:corrinoid methyltransferase-like protein
MATTLQVLSEGDCERIHASSLELLAGTGVRVKSERGRDLLYTAGAKPTGAENIVRGHAAVVTADEE